MSSSNLLNCHLISEIPLSPELQCAKNLGFSGENILTPNYRPRRPGQNRRGAAPRGGRRSQIVFS